MALIPDFIALALCLLAAISNLAISRKIPPLQISLSPLSHQTSDYLPVVIWHGMGDNADDPAGMGAIKRSIEATLPRLFVHSISLGGTPDADVLASFLGRVDDQVDHVCAELASLPQLKDGYVGIGFSQGGQFLRAAVQRCNHLGPPAKVLVTMGSQHQGVMDIPGCWQPSWNVTPGLGCRLAQRLLDFGAYNPFVQRHVVQAQYYKAPDDLAVYYKNSEFLADINLEAGDHGGRGPLPPHWQQYKANLMSLDRFVLFQFDNDITVVPKESAHFGFFDGQRLVPVKESTQYERLGLRELEEKGGLVFEHAPGMHMAFSLKWFNENVVKPYLAVRTTADGKDREQEVDS